MEHRLVKGSAITGLFRMKIGKPIIPARTSFHNALSFFIFLCLLSATFAAALAVRSHFASESVHAFEASVKSAVDAVSEDIAGNLAELHAIQGLFNASDDVDQNSFETFVAWFLGSGPGTQALEWIPRVPRADKEQFVLEMRAQRFDDFEIHPESDAGDYFPVTYLSPVEPNRPAIGFDLASEPIRRAALEIARDTGELTATEPLTLVQETESQAGFLVFAPVYSTGSVPETMEERRETLIGFGLAVFRVDDFLNDSILVSMRNELNLCVFDVGSGAPHSPIHVDKTAYPDLGESQLATIRNIDVAGRKWAFEFSAPTSFGVGGFSHALWIITLIAGTVFSLLLVGFSHLLINGKRRAVSLAEHMTRSLVMSEAQRDQMFELSQDLIMTMDHDGRFTFVSGAASGILGRNPSDLIGTSCLDLVHPEDQKKVRSYFESLWRGGKITSRDVRFLRSDGTVVTLNWNLQMIPTPADVIFAVARDVTRQRESEITVEHLRRQNELILNSAGGGIFGLDIRGRTTFINPSAAKMIGFDANELIGMPLHILFHHTKHNGSPYSIEECPIFESLRDGVEHRVADEVFWRSDGTSFPVEYISTPIRDDKGQLIGAVVSFDDISERKEVERMKDEFISVASHELRTPVTSIKGFLEMLVEDDNDALTDDQTRFIQAIERNTGRLEKLVNDLLDVSRLDTGVVVIEQSECDLSEIFGQVVSEMASDVATKDQKVNVGLPSEILVQCDRQRVVQILSNLLSNAIKYSPSHTSIELSANVSGDGKLVQIDVRDEGAGISEEEISKLFQRFKRLDNPATRTVQGTGLGLVITKALVELHGGEIWVESVVGKGTVFSFTLPMGSESSVLPETAAVVDSL